MTDTQRIGTSDAIRPHAYDPDTQPELFQGVLTRRFLAFIVDAIIILVPIVLLTLFIALFGLLTFGIGWLLFFLLTPIAILWAIVYTGATLGSPQSATIGMRATGLEMRTWYGSPMYFLLGAVHVIFLLGADDRVNSAHPAGRPVQPPPPPAARFFDRHDCDQQWRTGRRVAAKSRLRTSRHRRACHRIPLVPAEAGTQSYSAMVYGFPLTRE